METLSPDELAHRLVGRNILDEGFWSGIFVQTYSATEAEVFSNDFSSALHRCGVHVVQLNASEFVGSEPLRKIAKAVESSAPDGASQRSSSTDMLSKVIERAIRTRNSHVALLIKAGEVLFTETEGQHVSHALKAARDAINLQSDLNGKFLVIVTSCSPFSISDYVDDPSQAFYGATAIQLSRAKV
jgi:translation initiation factor 2B subunit (eIF-2B alpha/beta/delta family)